MMEKLQMPHILEGDTILRRKTPKDIDALWEILENHRESIGKYLNYPHRIKTRQALAEDIIADMQLWERGEKFSYCIICQDKPVGIIEVIRIDYKHHNAEFGYWLSPAEQGKGVMSKSLKILEDELFRQGVVRLVIGCNTQNEASARVAQRSGYQFEGVFRKSYCLHGQFTDSNRYAKINPAYESA